MNSLLSIEIGSSNIHLVEGYTNKGTIQIEKAKIFPILEGSLLGDRIGDMSLMAESLSDALRSFDVKTKETVVTFNATSAVIREIDLPNAKPKELDEMIKNELIQVYNILPSDIIQYKSIDKFTNDMGATITKYLAVALDSEIIEGYHTLLTSVKLKPVAMDLNVNAIGKLFSGDLSINDRLLNSNGIMLIDFGKTTTTIYLASKGKPLFHRHINFGCGKIEQIINDETFTSELEMRKLKEQGYNFFGEDDASKKYFSILKPFFYNFSDEIRKIMGFYNSRSIAGNGSIDQIYLYGGGSNLKGFAEYCESSFNIATEQIKTISTVKTKDIEASLASFLNAIGALIRH